MQYGRWTVRIEAKEQEVSDKTQAACSMKKCDEHCLYHWDEQRNTLKPRYGGILWGSRRREETRDAPPGATQQLQQQQGHLDTKPSARACTGDGTVPNFRLLPSWTERCSAERGQGLVLLGGVRAELDSEERAICQRVDHIMKFGGEKIIADLHRYTDI
jgi:hypothetical protein